MFRRYDRSDESLFSGRMYEGLREGWARSMSGMLIALQISERMFWWEGGLICRARINLISFALQEHKKHYPRVFLDK